MKVHDLISGSEVELPTTGVHSGRYRLSKACILNGNVQLSAGSILWRVGAGSARYSPKESPDQGVTVRFMCPSGPAAASNVVEQAIAAVIGTHALEQIDETLPSPLLPSALRELVEMSEPGPDLEHALASGQWDEISTRPRLDMHYIPETVPVARAKRVQASAVEHLSQHSELWVRRLITGVVPGKVLARVSEDDHAIYENVVFARLLDHCLRWLNTRISEVRAIEDSQRNAMNLEKGDAIHRLLSDRICGLWGKAWFNEPVDTKKTRDTLARLERMRTHIQRLRRTGVYTRVPRSARVPIRLRATNIFQYDKRYRELRPLWDAFASISARDQEDDVVRYKAMEGRQASFSAYVLLLLKHALRDMGAKPLDDARLKHRIGPWEVRIDTHSSGELKAHISLDGHLLKSRTLVLFLMKEGELECVHPDRSLFFAEDLLAGGLSSSDEQDSRVLNPFRFFAVEHLRHLLECDLGSIFLAQYPPLINRPIASVRDQLINARPDVFKRHGNELVVLPIASSQEQLLIEVINAACAGHPEMGKQLRNAVGVGQWVMRCRACGAASRPQDFAADERSMKLSCPSCKLETIVKTAPDRCMVSGFAGLRQGFDFNGGVEIQIS